MKKYFSVSFLLLAVFIFVTSAYSFGWFDTLQNKFTDRLFLKRTPEAPIVIFAIDDESIQKIGHWPWPREVFAKALAHLQRAKAIGFDINFSEPSSLGKADDLMFKDAIESSKASIVLPLQLRSDGEEVVVRPLADFSTSLQLGFVNVLVDSDNTIRRIAGNISDFKSFSSQLAGGEIPSILRINYVGPAKTITTLPFIDLYEGKLPESIIKDKIILIGATANDLHDFLDTPFGLLPGVEVHANAIETLVTAKYINDIAFNIGFFSLFLTVFLSGFLTVLYKRITSIILSLSGVFLSIVVASFISFQSGMILPSAYLFLGFMLAVAVSLVYQYVTENKEKQFIRKTFQYYLMPEVINEIMANPGKLVLGGEKKKLTVLFSDIRGFTSLSEKLSPEELVRLMNQYLTTMSDRIMENKGLVDKYIGDAIMAFWGAPLQNNDHAKDACLAAIEMSKRLKKLNAEWKAQGVPEIGIGIGLNTGEVIVGNMGSEKRFNYTIMGDEVNFGSRLEGLNKAYGTECIISEETKKAIENDSRFSVRELDNVMVKGKKEPKLIFELITKEESSDLKKILELFAKGRISYTKGDFEAALQFFKDALMVGEDGPSRAFVERCEYLMQHSPENWNGVYEFKTK